MKDKNENKSDITIHAVINGLVARSDSTYATSMLGKNDNIKTKSFKYKKTNKRSKFTSLPLIRGIVEFFEGLLLTIKGINDSTYFWEKEFEDEDNGSVLEALLMILSMVLSIALFIGGAFFVGDFLRRERIIPLAPIRGLVEGAIRVIIIVVCLKIAGLFDDIKNLYKNHTAGRIALEEIEGFRKNHIDKNAKKQTIFAFLMNVILICVFFFTVICIDNVWIQMICRIALIPIVSGLVYELYLFANKRDNILAIFFRSFGTIIERLIYVEPGKMELKTAREAIYKCQEKDEKVSRVYSLSEEELGEVLEKNKTEKKIDLESEEIEEIEEIDGIDEIADIVELEESEDIEELVNIAEFADIEELADIVDIEEIDEIADEELTEIDEIADGEKLTEIDEIADGEELTEIDEIADEENIEIENLTATKENTEELAEDEILDVDENMAKMEEEIEDEIEALELQLEEKPKEELQLEVVEEKPEEELQLEIIEEKPEEELQLEVIEEKPEEELQLEVVEEKNEKNENMVKTISGLAKRQDKEMGLSHENHIIGVENEDLNIRDIFYKGDDLDPSELYEEEDESIEEKEENVGSDDESTEEFPIDAIEILSIDDDDNDDEDDEILNALDKFLE